MQRATSACDGRPAMAEAHRTGHAQAHHARASPQGHAWTFLAEEVNPLFQMALEASKICFSNGTNE
jgi:hypothetical protein